jgi:hypothetical protein
MWFCTRVGESPVRRLAPISPGPPPFATPYIQGLAARNDAFGRLYGAAMEGGRSENHSEPSSRALVHKRFVLHVLR